MPSTGIRDLGDVLLRIAATFSGGLLLALALGVDHDAIKPWGWVAAALGCPIAYGVRAWGLREMQEDDEHERSLAEKDARGWTAR